MADAGNVFAAGTEGHGHAGFGNQLAGAGADDVHAQNFVGRGIGQELDHGGRSQGRVGSGSEPETVPTVTRFI